MFKRHGFTMVELLVVMAVLAVLALLIVPQLVNHIEGVTAEKDDANARALYSEMMVILHDGESSVSVIEDLLVGSYDLDEGELVVELVDERYVLTYKGVYRYP